MKKGIISTILSLSVAATMFSGIANVYAQANTPQYQTNVRQMEELDRGLIAVKTTADTRGQTVNGVYLSWRLLGTESLENQAFDIYRNDTLIHTTGAHDATCYIDTAGKETDTYKVVKAGADSGEVAAEKAVTPIAENYYAKPSEVGAGYSLKNSFTYVDIPIERPDPVSRMGDGKTSYYYTSDKEHEAGANDASVGDLDGDGEYEIVLKWDPVDSKDSAGADFTGNVYIDAYEIDPNNNAENNDNGHLYKWRIDLGKNVTAGAHYTQFMVYDFDGDGRSEIAMKTAPGSIDGTGRYVTEVGDTEEIRNVDNTASYIGTSGRLKGKNPFTQYLTIFDGETGAALWTTDFIPYEMHADSYWGDDGEKYNRSERYLAAVAYLDGKHPSIIMCRGYYHDTVIRAYNWDGSELTMLWEHNASKENRDTTMYGQGNHNLSIGDIDNDGKDEIVFGSAALDDDGKTVLGNTGLGHGDAMHLSDFNNDGVQEVFSVKEDKEGWYNKYAEDLRVAENGTHFWEAGKICWTTTKNPDNGKAWDNGRGVMDNIDDAYAKENPNALALGWSSGFPQTHDLNGDDVAVKPSGAGSGSFDNFLVYWDGDLGRELLDANIIQKYDAETGTTKRFYGPSDGYTLTGGSTNNYTKRTPSLVADIWGDWREEVIMPVNKGVDSNGTPLPNPGLRIFTSTMPTDYRLTTLMHDSQYRMSVAWQNVGYNQPTHTSYYVGSAALATDENGNELNYLAPAVPYTSVTYEAPENVPVTGITMDETLSVEKGQSVAVNYQIQPSDATKKGVTWTSEDETVATVANGFVKGVGVGTTTIKGVTRDGGFTAECEVTVYSTPVTGITISDKVIEVGVGGSKTLKATVLPDDATDKSVTWTTADEGVATVKDGVVTGVGLGKTTVTAISNDSGKTAECIVKVKPIETVDKTGENVFEVVGETPQNLSVDNNTASSVTLTHNDADNGVMVEKTFESLTDNKVSLTFKFVTGGQKYDGSNWNWTGHEYTTGLKFLDSEGNNILNIYQPYAEKAGSLMSAVNDGEAKAVTSGDSGWSNSGNVAGNIQGSSKRWLVNLEFDYANDVCNVRISGMDGTWTTEDGVMKQTISLDGKSFNKLQLYTTKDGSGTIKANPQISDLSYVVSTTAVGNSTTIFNKGFNGVEWTAEDIDGFVQTNQATASLQFDGDNGRIWYNPTKPGTAYSAEKTFDVTGDIVMYNVDWYFGNATGRLVNKEYIQFGNKLRLGWSQSSEGGYCVLLSTDGGVTYDGVTTDGTTTTVDENKKIFVGENTTYTKNVKVVFDTKTNTIKSLIFDGKTVDAYTNYKLADDATVNSVSFGFERGGSTNEWGYPCGIDSLYVSQFTVGEENPDFSNVRADSIEGNTVNVAYDLVNYTGENVQIVGALYDAEGVLVEMKASELMELPDVMQEFTSGTEALEFTNNPADYTLKLFMWDSVTNMMPVSDSQ